MKDMSIMGMPPVPIRLCDEDLHAGTGTRLLPGGDDRSLDMDEDSCLGSDCLRGDSEADDSAVRDCDENCLVRNRPRPFMLGDLGGGTTRCFRGESDAIDRD